MPINVVLVRAQSLILVLMFKLCVVSKHLFINHTVIHGVIISPPKREVLWLLLFYGTNPKKKTCKSKKHTDSYKW